jgi:hypothetical protein
MSAVLLPRSKIEAPERGPFSACCGADVKVEACRASLRRREALPRSAQYYFQAKIGYRCPRSHARGLPPSCIECQHPIR